MKTRMFLAALALIGIWFAPGVAGAHCDTLDGPVVKTARAALEKGDVSPVLKWIRKQDEPEIRERFARTGEAKRHAEESVEEGRAFVRAYVDYTHYVEKLHLDAGEGTAHGAEAEGAHHHH